ncbi:hypothetical protein [Siminovitchia fordii]|uniref:Uncharacterized protein n=1 Tax=Siminovitchia fordii TaxID=254759 RepID=A0ABQ4K6M1_9BACI|nr:hypothetical protein [Siminovitchia fordii]GIN20793.1 hypothetical protein J1TS3_19270 [Siminovitchia fordii]
MQLWVTLGLTGVLAAIAGFLVYYIHTVLDYDDARTIDSLPPDKKDD